MNKFLVVIDNLLSPEECDNIISTYDNNKLEQITRGDIANYDRAMFINQELATELFKRIKHETPEFYNKNHLVCCNDHFRFSKYHVGQKFGIHKDGFNQDSEGRRSILTLNIFLNDNFVGGSTKFFYDFQGTERFEAVPKKGSGVLFDSQQYHAGSLVIEGNKYLLRTDVMAEI